MDMALAILPTKDAGTTTKVVATDIATAKVQTKQLKKLQQRDQLYKMIFVQE